MAPAWQDSNARICYLRTIWQDAGNTNTVSDANSDAKEKASVTDNLECWRQDCHRLADPGLGSRCRRLPSFERRDFTVFVSREQAATTQNTELLQRLKVEQVEVQVLTTHDLATSQAEYPSSLPCDAFMLLKSDYALHIWSGGRVNYEGDNVRFCGWRDSLRLGAPEETRRLPKPLLMGHTRRGCCWAGKCNYWRRDHDEKWRNYKCPCCGGRCKRTKGCQKTGEYWVEEKKLPEWLLEAEEENGTVPPEFAREWMNMSAADTIDKYELRKGIGTAGRWRWRSIDTFAGDAGD
ncbi:conserved hypothetical protein [Verticillium alfalfae VaMs.102]|uniref:Uncharacterized protein n=1 Tax=Verticillium alfalfae (strain VaMs.102 / ATCC MYA-4576 / FGSC 10136) TaxID=526221 RepID=C9SXP5_VERA1|nr:conserved hypothetical protein [Verticillium alfalfae VaMs.102]EEY23435.1 conserved hypothetical protein [Verticillium alfalfae VaMs.102]